MHVLKGRAQKWKSAPLILKHGTMWNECGWSASCPGRLTSRLRSPAVYSVGGWVVSYSRPGRLKEDSNLLRLLEMELRFVPVAQPVSSYCTEAFKRPVRCTVHCLKRRFLNIHSNRIWKATVVAYVNELS